MINGIAEILKFAGEQKTKKGKIAVLKKYENFAMKAVLGHTYDPRIKFAVPTETPDYRPNEKALDLQNILINEVRRFYILLDCPKAGAMKMETRMKTLVGLLESVDPDDAELIMHMINRKLPYNGITKKLVNEAYPNLFTQE